MVFNLEFVEQNHRFIQNSCQCVSLSQELLGIINQPDVHDLVMGMCEDMISPLHALSAQCASS